MVSQVPTMLREIVFSLRLEVTSASSSVSLAASRSNSASVTVSKTC